MDNNKTVKIPVWDLDADEIIEMEIDEEALEAMDKEQEEIEKRREEARRKEHELLRYDRND